MHCATLYLFSFSIVSYSEIPQPALLQLLSPHEEKRRLPLTQQRGRYRQSPPAACLPTPQWCQTERDAAAATEHLSCPRLWTVPFSICQYDENLLLRKLVMHRGHSQRLQEADPFA